MAEIVSTGTEYLFYEVTELRGTVEDIVTVGVYYTTDPLEIPEVGDFTTVTLVDGISNPEDPLAEAGKIDIVALIGSRQEADLAIPVAGDYQEWVLITTADEDIIRRPSVLTVK